MQMAVVWCEEARRHGELLANAGSEEERQQVARDIQESAAFSALAIRAAFASDGALTTSAARDRHRAAVHGGT